MTEGPNVQPLDWLAAPRLAPYLRETDQDAQSAMELYVWCARMSAACFTTIGHLEVLLRHALDQKLAEIFNEESTKIPWFLRHSPLLPSIEGAVAAVRERLGNRETRDQIVAGLNFGFWAGMLSTRHDELWKHGLHQAFPHGPGLRKNLAVHVEALRKFRNRIAHHDSILRIDIPREMAQVFHVANAISPDAERWLREVDESLTVYSTRPVNAIDTLIVPGESSYSLYRECGIFLCQPGRSFRPIERVGFYAHKEIKPIFPAITARRDNVVWTEENAAILRSSADRVERKIATAISDSRGQGMTNRRYQVFLLTSPQNPATRTINAEIPHLRRGQGSAFVRKPRYFSLHALENARTTEDLMQ